MGRRRDHREWVQAEYDILDATLELPAHIVATRINNTVHGGEPVRTQQSVGKRRWERHPPTPKAETPAPTVPDQTIEVKDTGDVLHVTSYGHEVRTIDELIRRASIDLTKYEVDRPETSMHETTVRDSAGNVRKVQNFRIVARFRLKAGPNVAEQVEALIAGAFATRKPLTHKAHKPRKDADVLQAIVIADPHIGKYSWTRETGHEDYDIGIATRLIRSAASELLEWGDREPVGKRAIWCLGDIAHYDTPHGQTTGGTPLDRDGRVEKMMEEASAVLFDIIEAAAQRGPVEVVMVQGNHDFLMTLAFRQILSAYFRNDKRVTVDTRGTTRKYITHGRCLLGLTHGDKAQKRLGELMSVEAREQWGKASLREIHHGHRHCDAMITTVGGVTIRQHPSLSPPDGWHSLEGFVGAPQAMDSYLYHADGYLLGTRRSTARGG